MTYSAITVLQTLRHSYGRMVVDSIDDLPLIAPFAPTLVAEDRPFADVAAALQQPTMLLADGGRRIRGRHVAHAGGRRHHPGRQPTGMIEVLPQGEGPADEVVRAVAFHTAQEPPPAAAPTPEQQAADRQALHDSVDFHKIISSLNEHPALLRRLGLVIDLAVPRSATQSDLRHRTAAAAVDQRVPRRRFDQDRPAALDRLAARSGGGAAVRGRRTTGCPASSTSGRGQPFSVHPMALDSAVLQTVAMVSALPQRGERSAPPALRSGGLTLIQEGRSQAAHADLTAAMQDDRGSSPDTALRPHDVTRGYRLDVFDTERAVWRSLHARRVTYAKGDAPLIEPVLDEGSHHPSATGPAVAAGAEPAADAPIFLHESFVRWDGWSLSAPRPGRSLGVDPSGPDPSRPETMPQHSTQRPADPGGAADRDERAAAQPAAAAVRAQVPGAGPDRRPGRQRSGSRGRRRTLAAPVGDPAGDRASGRPGHSWRRGDPLRAVRAGAAAGDHPAQPGAAERSPDRAAHPHRRSRARPSTSAECLLFAPKGTVELAEWHGRFDDAIGSGDAALVRASYDVAARESGVLPDAGADELPYLPDPLAIGVAIAGGPGVAPGNTPAIEWRGTSWDRPRPITLRLAVNDLHFQPPPDIDEDASLITIKLDPALRAQLRLSSLIPDGTPFGLMDWLGEDAVGAELTEDLQRQLRRAIDDSRHVMFTPWEDMEVVHAVQRPLEAPNLEPAETPPPRKPGDTVFKPNCTLIREPLSTATLTPRGQLDRHRGRSGGPLRTARRRRPDAVAAAGQLRGGQHHAGHSRPGRRRDAADTAYRRLLHRLDPAAAAVLRHPAPRGELHRDRAQPVRRRVPRAGGQPDAFTRIGTPATSIAQSTARPPAPVVADVVPLVSTGPVSVSAAALSARAAGCGSGWSGRGSSAAPARCWAWCSWIGPRPARPTRCTSTSAWPDGTRLTAPCSSTACTRTTWVRYPSSAG